MYIGLGPLGQKISQHKKQNKKTRVQVALEYPRVTLDNPYMPRNMSFESSIFHGKWHGMWKCFPQVWRENRQSNLPRFGPTFLYITSLGVLKILFHVSW